MRQTAILIAIATLVAPAAATMHCCKSWGKGDNLCRQDGPDGDIDRATPTTAGEGICPDTSVKTGKPAQRKVHDVSGDAICQASGALPAETTCAPIPLSPEATVCKKWLEEHVGGTHKINDNYEVPEESDCCVKEVLEGLSWEGDNGLIDCEQGPRPEVLKTHLKKCKGEHTDTVVKGHVDSDTDENRAKNNRKVGMLQGTSLTQAGYRFLRKSTANLAGDPASTANPNRIVAIKHHSQKLLSEKQLRQKAHQLPQAAKKLMGVKPSELMPTWSTNTPPVGDPNQILKEGATNLKQEKATEKVEAKDDTVLQASK